MSDVPPVGHRVVCIDFDGTIFPWGGLYEEHKKPLKHARQVIKNLRSAGFRIVILTSRLSPTWARAETKSDMPYVYGRFLDHQREYIAKMLDKHDIPYDDITSEKVPAEAYIDDKAVEFCDNWWELGLSYLWGDVMESA